MKFVQMDIINKKMNVYKIQKVLIIVKYMKIERNVLYVIVIIIYRKMYA